jgi:hypothetical protein
MPGDHCSGEHLVEGRGSYCLNIGGVQIDNAMARAFLAALEPATITTSIPGEVAVYSPRCLQRRCLMLRRPPASGTSISGALYQHLRPSIARQEHQPDSEWSGALRHSIARNDEMVTQQQMNKRLRDPWLTAAHAPASGHAATQHAPPNLQ